MTGYTTKWQRGNRKTKYGAVSQTYNGRTYDSKREAAYATELDWRIKAGEVTEVIPQYQVGIYISGSLWRTWKIDFKVVMKDGSVELHEVKGFETPDFKMKFDALLRVMESTCDCNYITEYKTGNRIDNVKIVIVK